MSSSIKNARRLRVVIAGGGVAALEALLALGELAGHRVELTLLCPEREFLPRPRTVAEPFGWGGTPGYLLRDIIADRGGRLASDSLQAVESDRHVAVTGSGERIPYDALAVAIGAVAVEPLPGALTFRGRPDVAALSAVLDELARAAARSVAFTLVSEPAWPLPLYELALMTAAHLREHGVDVPVWLVTPEEEPLELFGPAAACAIKPMLRVRGIRLRTSSRPALVHRRALVLAGGGEVPADGVITLPRLQGPGLPGLPHDRDGFVPVDRYGRVRGRQDVYAAGDITAFPLKQGGLAAQHRPGAVVAAGEDRGALPGSIPGHRAASAPVIRPADRPGFGAGAAAPRGRIPGRARAGAAAGRFRRSLGRLSGGVERARRGRDAPGSSAGRLRGQAPHVERGRAAAVETRNRQGARPRWPRTGGDLPSRDTQPRQKEPRCSRT